MKTKLVSVPTFGAGSLEEAIATLLRTKKEKLIEAYKDLLGYNVEEKHGPIEEWFPFGSECTMEMPVITTVGFMGDEIVAAILDTEKL